DAEPVEGTAFTTLRTCERSCALIAWSVAASRPTRATIDASAARTARSWRRPPRATSVPLLTGPGYGPVSRSLISPADGAGTARGPRCDRPERLHASRRTRLRPERERAWTSD